MFHVDYLQEIKSLKLPVSLSKMNGSYLTYANMIGFSYEVLENEYKVIKEKNLNEVCSYVAVTSSEFIVVPQGTYSSYAIDKYATTFDNLDDALKMLESLTIC